MIKVAIIRGAALNKFEMQSYEPLSRDFYLEAFVPRYHWYDISDLKFNITRLHSFEGIPWWLHASSIFRGISLYKKIIAKIYYAFGQHNSYMIGLDRRLRYFDIVHTAETFTNYSAFVAMAKKRYGFKTVVTVWENLPFNHERRNREKRYKRCVFDNTDIFMAVTDKAKKALIVEGVPADKIRVVPAGIDIDVFKSGPKDERLMVKLGIEKGDFVVLFVGRLERHKGVFNILASARDLLKDDDIKKPLKFIFVGRGEERNTILELARKYGIERNIILTGNIKYRDMKRFYRLADIFVLPSIPVEGWEEQFGMSLVEAMASSLPVVSTSTGSIPGIVSDCGVLIKPDDSEALRNEIKRLMFDEPLRKRLSDMARDRVVRFFSKEIVSEKLRQIYLELIDTK